MSLRQSKEKAFLPHLIHVYYTPYCIYIVIFPLYTIFAHVFQFFADNKGLLGINFYTVCLIMDLSKLWIV